MARSLGERVRVLVLVLAAEAVAMGSGSEASEGRSLTSCHGSSKFLQEKFNMAFTRLWIGLGVPVGRPVGRVAELEPVSAGRAGADGAMDTAS